MSSIKNFKKKISEYICKTTPFIFVIDFECEKPFICELKDAENNGIYYDIKGKTNYQQSPKPKISIKLQSYPISKSVYDNKINKVINHINHGDSYLLNLSFPSEIDINIDLKQIFEVSKAPYKLLFKDKFTVFSPECFVEIVDNEIFTYPMKGTIDATLENSEQLLLNNKKEQAEHNTIVDLMRNDISMIAQNIEITKYRYIDRIKTNKNEILQTSSKIKGQLPNDWKENFGESLIKLLPAGSISGAPKKKTVEIIETVEPFKRGYYTGIFGVFDGNNFDSAVSIRYIEKQNNKMFFRSGGGITSQSNIDDEYNELIQKIYIPEL